MADSGARITQEILLLAVGDDAWIRLRTGWARSGGGRAPPRCASYDYDYARLLGQ